jgi:hypothetical protein
MSTWNFLSHYGQALLCIARDPDARLRDIADCVGITECRTYDIVNDLVEAGYVAKEKEGRRNRYEVQGHLPLPDERSSGCLKAGENPGLRNCRSLKTWTKAAAQ